MKESDTRVLDSIETMLHPKSICVIGANPGTQYGGRFLTNLIETKFSGKVYPVNPKYQELMGVRCYPNVSALPEAPDLAGIIVPYEITKNVLEECAAKGVKTGVMITGGFAELQTEDRKDAQKYLQDFAIRTEMRLCGPNCLGIANVKDNIWPASAQIRDIRNTTTGELALVSQSGASAFQPFLLRAQDRGLGYSYIISTGNEADLDAADFIRYCLRQPEVKAVVCYFEAIKDPDKFREVAGEALDAGKPIVALKIGRSPAGMKAAISHTASMTGSDKVIDALFKQMGITRVEDWDELLETGNLLAKMKRFKKKTVGVVAHSGGVASLLSDKCEQVLAMPQPSAETRKGLDDILKSFGSPANPADVTWHGHNEDFNIILKLLLDEEAYGGLVIGTAGTDEQSQRIIKAASATDKPVAMLWTSSERAEAGLRMMQKSIVPVFYRSENLWKALRASINYYETLDRWRRNKAIAPVTPKPVSLSGRGRVSLKEGLELLSCFGIKTAKYRVAGTLKEAGDIARDIGYPVVLKAQMPHKTDLGLVKIGLKSRIAVEGAYREIRKKLDGVKGAPDGILVQEMVSGGTEVIVGVKKDPQFGPVLMFGTGGVLTELIQDASMRICPVTRDDIKEMLLEVKGLSLLKGFRGRPPCDILALEDALFAVANLAMRLGGQLQELDINPLIVLPEGQGVKAVDALIVLD